MKYQWCPKKIKNWCLVSYPRKSLKIRESNIQFTISKNKKEKKKYQNNIEKKLSEKLGSLDADSASSLEENNSDNFDEKYEGKGLNVSMPTMSSASLSRTSSLKTNIAKGKKDEKADEKAKRQETVTRYTIIILIW